MTFIKIEPNADGSHDHLSSPQLTPDNFNDFWEIEGWAVIPESVGTLSTLKNFPFGTVTVEHIGGVPTVTSWSSKD